MVSEILDFIAADAEKDARTGRGKLALFVIFTAALPTLLGILMRRDYAGVFSPASFIPHLIAALSLGLFTVLYRERNRTKNRALLWASLILAIALLCATERAYFPDGPRSVYATSEDFSRETLACFQKGILASVLTGTWFLFFAFRLSSFPPRRWRILLSVASSTAAAVMLGFHCDSSSELHVFVGHVLSGTVVGIAIAGVSEVIFRRKIRTLAPNFHNPKYL